MKKVIGRISPVQMYTCPNCGKKCSSLKELVYKNKCVECGKTINIPKQSKNATVA